MNEIIIQISLRSFTVAAGSYDVFVIAKEPTPEKAPKNAPAPKASFLKQTVVVPDFWNGDLSTSSVKDAMDAHDKALGAAKQSGGTKSSY